ncbi:MAG: glycoside hydrolase family 25 protein [Oscillospiraceae bacterium]|nr:glycoside hydrolase family 25 protein [Oscillospiraceae bacterium]
MKNKSGTVLKVVLLVFAIILLCIVTGLGTAMLLLQLRADIRERNSHQTIETEEPTGPSFLFHDPFEGDIWVPDLEGVAHCSYDPSKIVNRNGRKYYVEDGQITSAVGIDVSFCQEEIDWEQVKASGIVFAFIRCGCRTYGSGRVVEDTYFRQNMEGALAAGMDVGVYFYSQAINPSEARTEAEFVLGLVEGYDLTYPIAFDWEFVDNTNARTNDISREMLTSCTKVFCDTIQKAGYTPIIYQNCGTALSMLDLTKLTDYDLWLADHNSSATYYYDYRIWQYCSDGHVPGITGDVDVNICYRPYERTETEG